MKQNRKGFSLVELIVVLVIMAIIAALCAPNISAYVQAAKIQNYQTVANNLADELQTQLPQSRYWNWDEVKQSAEGILRSDAGRGVTLLSSSDTEEKYQVTGASSDANAVFTVTLTYQPADKTKPESGCCGFLRWVCCGKGGAELQFGFEDELYGCGSVSDE